MKPDFAAVLYDFDDKPFDDQITMQAAGLKPDAEKIKLTLGMAARHALCWQYTDEPNLAGAEKFDRGMLAFRIKNNDGEFSVEDIALVKKMIGRLYGPSVVLCAWRLLDPPN